MSQFPRLPRAFSAVLIAALGLALTINAAGPTNAAPGAPPAAISHSNAPAARPQAACGVLDFARTDYPVGTTPQSVVIGDLNGDGHPDLAVANRDSSNVSVLLNNGSGGFITTTAVPVVGGASGVVIADFNRDGKADIAVTNLYSNSVSILLGNGNGSFQPPVTYAVGGSPQGIAVGDFNNDGKLDLVVADSATDISYHPSSVSVLLGNGDGTFQAATYFTTGAGSYSVVVSDFNRDGNADIATANYNAESLTVLLGNGNGTFQAAYTYPAYNEPASLSVGDLNGDGAPDLVVAGYNSYSSPSYLLNDGNGFFPNTRGLGIGYDVISAAVADFDGDGKLDIVGGDNTGHGDTVDVALGNGDGTFNYSINFPTGPIPNGIVAGDLNGDGLSDIVTANYEGNSVSVLLNICSHTLPTPTPTNTFPPAISPTPTNSSTPTATPICPNGTLNPWELNSNPNIDPFANIAVTSDDNYIYAGGGTNGSYSFNASYLVRYDRASEQWLGIGSFFSDTFDSASAVYSPINHKLYFFGGINDYDGTGHGTTVTHTRIYDLASQNTRLGAPMPAGRAGMAAGYWNDKIYLVGGISSVSPFQAQAQVWEYDPLLDSWNTSRLNMPAPIAYPAYGVVNGHLYVTGGTTGSGVSAVTYDYDIQSNTWSTSASIPLAVAQAGSVVVNGRIYVLGGNTTYPAHNMGQGSKQPAVVTNVTQVYDPAANTWSSDRSLGVARSGLAAGFANNLLVAVGGYYTNTTEIATVTGSCGTPTPPPTLCANPFTDINSDIFFQAINNLNCRGVINGTDATHYSPGGTATRAQFAKVVTLAFGIQSYTPPGGQDFTDVPPSYFAYLFIESGYHAGILNGFDAASCTAHNTQFPCYLPNLAITRGQLTKLVVSAAHYPTLTPSAGGQTFTDVPPNNVFFTSIETAYYKGVISGYPNLTFRPNNSIRRDEMAQIVYKGITTP